MLSCKARGVPDPKYEFFKVGWHRSFIDIGNAINSFSCLQFCHCRLGAKKGIWLVKHPTATVSRLFLDRPLGNQI